MNRIRFLTVKRDKLRILHITPGVGKSSFGVGQVVINLAVSQNIQNCMTNIWSYDKKNEINGVERTFNLPPNTIRSFNTIGPLRYGFSPHMVSSIWENLNNFDIIHQHGIWTGESIVTSIWRKIGKKPVIISPHGSLDPWGLNISVWKKKLALFFFEKNNLNKSNCLHALSINEAKNIHAFGLYRPIAIIPNGIQETWLIKEGNGDKFKNRYSIPRDQRIMLYLGRITPVKGLDMLVNALSEIKDQIDGWILIIAGDDEFNYQKDIYNLIKSSSLEGVIKFVGSQYGQEKRDAFAAADLFVLPSYSEGSPIVLLEALGAGVPVLATKASPWEDLEKYNCGFLVDISETSLKDKLLEVAHFSKETLHEMGVRGKQLVKNKYTWDIIATQTIKLYKWMLNENVDPPPVIIK